MTLARSYAAAALGMLKRDAVIFVSYRFRFVSQILTGFFTVTLFYYISRLVSIGGFRGPDDYFAFAVVGLIVLQVLTSTLSVLPINLRQELVAGTLERIVLSPFGTVAAVLAMTIFPFALALAHATLMIVVATLVFGMPLAWSTVPLAAPLAVLGMLAFLPFALLLAASVLVVKQAGVGAGFVVTGIALIGGFLFPVTLLPAWIQWASEVQPFTPALGLLRHVLVGAELTGPASTEILKVALFAAVFIPATMVILGAAVRQAQRRGTIIEY